MAENSSGLPAISLHQPWASLIAVGAKPYETRAFAPWRSLIGKRIAIHAAKKPIGWLHEADPLFFAAVARAFGNNPRWNLDLPLGAVVCTAVLRGAYQCGPARAAGVGAVVAVSEFLVPSPPPAGEIRLDLFGDYSEGRWAWHLTDIERLDPPVPAKGKQGFWSWAPTTPALPLRAAAEGGA